MLWLELLERHGNATVLAEQLPDSAECAALRSELRVVGELLSSSEEIIRQRLMNDRMVINDVENEPLSTAAAVPPPLPVPLPPKSRKTTTATAFDSDGEFQLDGLELQHRMVQNHARNVGLSPPPVVYRPPFSIALSNRDTSSTWSSSYASLKPPAPEHAKKRKQEPANDATGRGSREPITTGRRPMRKIVEGLAAERVLRHRDGNHVCEYLVQWTGRSNALWVYRKEANEQTKAVIDAYNRTRKTKRPLKLKQKPPRASAAADAFALAAALETSTMAEGDIFVVDKIVNHRVRYGRKEYLVQWDGYDASENTWEAAEKLQADVGDVVDAYEQRVAQAEQRQQLVSGRHSKDVGGDSESTRTRRRRDERGSDERVARAKASAQTIDVSDGEEDDRSLLQRLGLAKHHSVVVGGSDSEGDLE